MATKTLPFVKMQAIGNDFVVVEEKEWPEETNWNELSIRLCDRNFGIGGDGLLVLSTSKTADARMWMFNPDGTEDMCGNGLRCIALLAHQRGMLQDSGTIETIVGVRLISLDTRVSPVEIVAEMGVPLFTPKDIPANVSDDSKNILDYPLSVEGCGELPVSMVNTGSTHTVIWVDELPDDSLFFMASPQIETDSLFPERTNVLWAKVVSDGRSGEAPLLQIRIWERGAGETLGCGTGACAVAILALAQGKVVGESVAVRSKGGVLQILSRGIDSPLEMTGPSEIVYTGTVSVP